MPTHPHPIPSGYTTADIQRFYDEMAPTYQRLERSLALLGERRMRRRLMARACGHILDVACGTGENFPYLPAHASLTAIDLSDAMLTLARQRADQMGIQPTLQRMDAEHLDFPDNHFDTVITALSTCTIPDPVAALREMGRVCKSDGQLLLLEHGRSRLGPVAYLQDRTAKRWYEGDGCRWNQDTLDLVREAGLRLTRVRRALVGIFYSLEAAPQP